MSINLPYVEGTSEKLRRILRSHKIRSTFYTENTLRKLLCKPKDRVATEDKSNIIMKLKTLLIMKLTVVTVKLSTLVSLTGLQNSVQINTKDMLGVEIVIRMKLLNNAGKQTSTLTWIIRKLLIGKAG